MKYGILFLGFFCSLSLFAQKKKIVTGKEIWLDYFDTKSNKSLQNGGYFTYTDQPNKGASTASHEYVLSLDKKPGYAMKLSYILDKADYRWDPYVALGLALDDSLFSVGIDMIKGIAYDYKGSRHHLIYQTKGVKDYAHYRRLVPESNEWTTIVIPIEQLKQPMWGRAVPLDLTQINGLSWSVMGYDGEEGELVIDNIRFLKKLPPIKEVDGDEFFDLSAWEKQKKEIKKSKDNEVLLSLTEWPQNKKAAYSFTFDDGLLSQYKYVKPILDSLNIKATFYILPDQLEKDNTKTPSWRYGYLNQFKQLKNEGHEIAAHSMTHAKLSELPSGCDTCKGTVQYEVAYPKVALNKYFGTNPVTYAYPFGDFNNQSRALCLANYQIIRGVWEGYNSASIADIDNLKVNSFNYTAERTLENDLAKVDFLKKDIQLNMFGQNKWGVFLAHDILPIAEISSAKDTWMPVSLESFKSFAIWITQHKSTVWIDKVETIGAYVIAKNEVSISKGKLDGNTIKFILKNKNKSPNLKLTFVFDVPENKKVKSVKVDGVSVEFETVNSKIYFDVIPQGELMIQF